MSSLFPEQLICTIFFSNPTSSCSGGDNGMWDPFQETMACGIHSHHSVPMHVVCKGMTSGLAIVSFQPQEQHESWWFSNWFEIRFRSITEQICICPMRFCKPRFMQAKSHYSLCSVREIPLKPRVPVSEIPAGLIFPRYDDYDYGEVNQLLERSLKVYIKTVTCYPERTTKRMYDSYWRQFKHSEKVSVWSPDIQGHALSSVQTTSLMPLLWRKASYL